MGGEWAWASLQLFGNSGAVKCWSIRFKDYSRELLEKKLLTRAATDILLELRLILYIKSKC